MGTSSKLYDPGTKTGAMNVGRHELRNASYGQVNMARHEATLLAAPLAR